jgi:molybdopterin biosynthesis enzyme
MWLVALTLRHGVASAPGRVSRLARRSIKSAFACVSACVNACVNAYTFARASIGALLAAATLCVAACGATPAQPVPFKAVSADRIVRAGYTEPVSGKVAVDVRRERTGDVIVRFRDALVYIDGERVADLMNGEHVVFYLTPGLHRLAVSTQFDPVRELQLIVTADPRYTNRASITFDADHRIVLTRVAQ